MENKVQQLRMYVEQAQKFLKEYDEAKQSMIVVVDLAEVEVPSEQDARQEKGKDALAEYWIQYYALQRKARGDARDTNSLVQLSLQKEAERVLKQF